MVSKIDNQIRAGIGCAGCQHSEVFVEPTMLKQYQSAELPGGITVHRLQTKMFLAGELNCHVLHDKVPPSSYCDALKPR